MDSEENRNDALAILPPSEEDGPPMESTGSDSRLNAIKAFKGEGAECAICFAPLPTEPVCVLIRHVYGRKRSCRHYFHLGCVHLLQRTTPAPHLCPLCREPFERCMQLPDVRLDSRAWFCAVDADDGQALEKTEVVDALAATLPVDPELLGSALDGELWEQWDSDKTGRITLENFENPARGLLQFVLYSLPSLRREAGTENRAAPVPDLVISRESWFRYWDENCQHVLWFLQCLRALVMTWRLDGAKEDAGVVRNVLAAVFAEFGLSNEDGPVRPVTLRLFCEKPDGFCDSLVDALKSAFGATKFNRMRQRALLLQQPALQLKRQLVKLKPEARAIIEKEELVDALLDVHELNDRERERENTVTVEQVAEALLSTPLEQQQRKQVSSGIRSASVKELKSRLRELGVASDHCVQREDLEELLSQAEEKHQRKRQRTTEPVPEPPRSGNVFLDVQVPSQRQQPEELSGGNAAAEVQPAHATTAEPAASTAAAAQHPPSPTEDAVPDAAPVESPRPPRPSAGDADDRPNEVPRIGNGDAPSPAPVVPLVPPAVELGASSTREAVEATTQLVEVTIRQQTPLSKGGAGVSTAAAPAPPGELGEAPPPRKRCMEQCTVM
mmetsp:Transcript_46794/g.111300  ORF Transcript_46794/g.111300 Transcript_46794/m.111300 type:complete len:614 (-) Transcript_46794:58-1899(-)